MERIEFVDDICACVYLCVCLRIEAITSHIFFGPLHVKPQPLDIPKKNRHKNARLWNKSLRVDVQIAFNVLNFSLDLKKLSIRNKMFQHCMLAMNLAQKFQIKSLFFQTGCATLVGYFS